MSCKKFVKRKFPPRGTKNHNKMGREKKRMRKPRRESVFIVQLLSFCVQRKKTDDVSSSSPKPFFLTSNAQFDDT